MTASIPLETLIRFWAKTTHDKDRYPNAYHPLLCHMIDVAAVTLVMWDEVLSQAARMRIVQAFGLSIDKGGIELAGKIVAWISGLHDLGKASPPFILRKSASHLHWLYQNTDFSLAQTRTKFHSIPLANQAPHGYITAATLPLILEDLEFPTELARLVSEIIGGHHGTFAESGDLTRRRKQAATVAGSAELGNQQWQEARRAFAVVLADLLGLQIPDGLQSLTKTRFDHAVIMILAGLVSVADWLGSNSDHFPCKVKRAKPGCWEKISLQCYRLRAERKARKAMLELGWLGWPVIAPGDYREYEALFPELALLPNWQLRPAQEAAQTIAKDFHQPGIVVIEAPMGEGKTEAAIYLADYWNVTFQQRGIYFALPTMATSNQMFGRVCEYLSARFSRMNVPVHLLHGHSSMMADFKKLLATGAKVLSIKNNYCDDPHGKCDGALLAADWFTHRKHGLLVPFGVGTVDQALLAALRTRHVFVRLFGLAHRSIIIDEVHAYDAYMSELLERLLEWLGALGSPVVLLSATLPADKRGKLVNAYLKGQTGNRHLALPLPQEAYPRLTWTVGGQIHAKTLSSSTPLADDKAPLSIEWVDGELPGDNGYFPLGEKLRAKLKRGGCAAVICNTVDRAQRIFQALEAYFHVCAEQGLRVPELGLFHARFLLEDRNEREKQTLERFGKRGKKIRFDDDDERGVKRPERFVLVATQVIEQSLDIDFDLMVSDFAPLDLILQRAGRIWRHANNPRFDISQPTLWLCRPELVNDVPRFDVGTEAVYTVNDGTVRKRGDENPPVPYVLLRSWLALHKLKQTNGCDDSFTISLSREIEDLIEETYREQPCPTDLSQMLQAAWTTARDEHARAIQSQQLQAGYKLFESPYYRGLLGDFFKDAKEEDAPEIHLAHQALTRLGDSLNLICLTEDDAFNPKAKPDDQRTEALLRRSVSIARRDVIKALRREVEIPAGWRKSPLLRHYRAVHLNQPTAGFVFRYDTTLGLRIEKTGKETQ